MPPESPATAPPPRPLFDAGPDETPTRWRHPLRSALRHMNVGKKLMVIYLLDLAAVIFVTGLLISEKRIATALVDQERQGLAYLQQTIEPYTAAALALAGVVDGAVALQDQGQHVLQADRAHGFGPATADPAKTFASSLAAWGASGPAGGIAPPGPGPLVTGRELIGRIGNASMLVLDPELQSYYAMSMVVFRFPDLVQAISDLGRHVHLTQRQGSELEPHRVRLLVLLGQLDAYVAKLQADHAELTAASPPEDRAARGEGLARIERALADLLPYCEQLGAARPTIEQVALLQQLQAELLSAVAQTWSRETRFLDTLLERRSDALFLRKVQHLGGALLILAAILGVVTTIARSITRPLVRLAAAAEAVGQTGDYAVRVRWDSSDEIGRLVSRFNGMLAELDHTREQHKEMAAAARAATAQQELVEATPLPVVVTAYGSHEVLHANPPAAGWLQPGSPDPWQAGLPSAVRERFFEQLQARGRVDEFEVRWQGPAEATWAVLSARRMRYQGQDAVLTAFAPINHLKLMERRLRLWARVFEASSEGIVIFDDERRIVTANQALSRSTGQLLPELIGEPADRVFRSVQPDLWSTVDRGDTWRGEVDIHRRDGSTYPAWLMASGVREAPGDTTHYILTTIDITDRRRSEKRIRYLAEHDVLTELPNRSLVSERLRLALQQAALGGQKVAVLFIDLDRFKDINDSLGHHIGDGLLRSVANRLVEAVRAGDTVGRLGGDEFLVVLSGVDGADEVAQIVDSRLVPRIRAPHPVEGAELHVSCSIGIALYPDDGRHVEDLMKHADVAMYQAKSEGKDAARFFTNHMTERTRARVELDSLLRRALALGQFELHYQPRVDARTHAIVGAEALIRWNHPQHGLVPPAHFIPLAEETGLIVPMGEWVIDEACRQIVAWHEQGLSPFTVSVNISARQMRDDHLIEAVRGALARHGVDPARLELELTESIVMDNAERSLKQMHALRDVGVQLSIDDFGTGYSSLAYLNRFPLNKLKIDRTFVRDLLTSPTDQAITRAVIGLGHTIGMTVVAEGVESAAVAEALREAGCDELQGYLYGRPMPAAQLALRLAQGFGSTTSAA